MCDFNLEADKPGPPGRRQANTSCDRAFANKIGRPRRTLFSWNLQHDLANKSFTAPVKSRLTT